MSNDVWEQLFKENEMIRQTEKAAMQEIGDSLEADPYCHTYSTAYKFAVFSAEAPAAIFKDMYPDWDVEVGEKKVFDEPDSPKSTN